VIDRLFYFIKEITAKQQFESLYDIEAIRAFFDDRKRIPEAICWAKERRSYEVTSSSQCSGQL